MNNDLEIYLDRYLRLKGEYISKRDLLDLFDPIGAFQFSLKLRKIEYSQNELNRLIFYKVEGSREVYEYMSEGLPEKWPGDLLEIEEV